MTDRQALLEGIEGHPKVGAFGQPVNLCLNGAANVHPMAGEDIPSSLQGRSLLESIEWDVKDDLDCFLCFSHLGSLVSYIPVRLIAADGDNMTR